MTQASQVFSAANDDRAEFIISRTFAAPLSRVFEAWTKPEQLKRWWSPKGFACTQAQMDFRPGGTYHYCLRSPEGIEMWGKLFYREIDAPRKLAYLTCFSDKEGNITRHPLSLHWPREMMTVVHFREEGAKTVFTVHWTPHNAGAEEIKTFEEGMDSMQQGWTGTLDQLEALLAGK